MRFATFRLSLAGALCESPMSAFGQTGAPVQLKLSDAEALALKNHPQVLAAQNETFAQNRRIVEARSSYYPSVNGEVTGSAGNLGARIGAGFLSDSRLFDRFGDGVEINQLITDFGRTPSLVSQSRLQANAAQQNYQATRYDVLLRVNQAYFNALRSQALVKVAQKTVDARQLLAEPDHRTRPEQPALPARRQLCGCHRFPGQIALDPVAECGSGGVRGIDSRPGRTTSGHLSIGGRADPAQSQANAEDLVGQALQNRPELAGLRLTRDAAYRFEDAERDLKRPTASFVGVAGYMPYIDQITLPRVIPNEYAGAAVNVQIPVFNGHLFTARREEAHYRAVESDQRVRDLEDSIARDVRTAWADAQTAYQALTVTAEFLREATMALDLAQGRFQLQLSSIVELTQSQLNQTEAEIENLNAKYDYQSAYAALQYAIGALR